MERTDSILPRIKVRAAIIRDDHILLVEYGNGWEPHFNLPGGSMEPDETLINALKREVREETCADIDVGRLLLVLDFNVDHPDSTGGVQPVLELIFEGMLPEHGEPRLPDRPDPHQVAVRWLPIDNLPGIPLRPKVGEQLRAALRIPRFANMFIENPPQR